MITLERHVWRKIEAQLKEDYKERPSIFLLRSVMKRELGFTVRQNNYWHEDVNVRHTVYLDFFDDQKETLFILKYL